MELPDFIDCKEIYTGRQSRLYSAKRAADGCDVVLKFPKELTDGEEIAAIEQEFRILAKLKDSPAIPRFFAIHRYKNAPFIEMEKIPFPSVADYLAKKKRLHIGEILRLSLALLSALENIHRFDIIHKDFNIYNLHYDEKGGSCTAVDFDLSVPIDRQRAIAAPPSSLEGTLPYLSPEQTGRLNRGVDYRTDYYALGVTLYRIATGRLPFASTDPLEIVHAHIALLPTPLEELDPAIPEAFSAIVLKLLNKEPEERYQSIVGIRSDLEECQRRLKGSVIAPFPIGTKDTRERFSIPDRIYGRERELEAAIDSYELAAAGHPSLLFISGEAGIGKSSLVKEIYKPISKKKGKIISGKFEVLRRNIPYLAFTQAFNDFMVSIAKESDEVVDAFKEKILKALGSSGQIIVDVVPNLEAIIGKQPPVAKVGLEETNNRFSYFFERFIKALPTKERPLALYLDDLQWADATSIRLLEALIHIQCPYLLIICGYRDREIDEWHPLKNMLRELDKLHYHYSHLSLPPLEIDSTTALIADTLCRKKEELPALATLCHDKTGGNPFFLHQLLEKLYADKSIAYNWESAIWEWDIEKIHASRFSDSVVELMIDKIKSLGSEERELLAKASAIGSRFSIGELQLVTSLEEAALRPKLELLLQRGFIATIDLHYYSAKRFQFTHDRIQQAAHELLSESELVTLHLAVAKELLSRGESDKLPEQLLAIADHYNATIDKKGAPSDRGERKNIAKINAEAAKRAKGSAAYEVAEKYNLLSLKWIGKEEWEEDYPFLIDLYTELMECAFLTNKYEEMDSYSAIIFKNKRRAIDSKRAAELNVLYHTANRRYGEAVRYSYEVINELGLPFVSNPKKGKIAYDFIKVLLLLAAKKISVDKLKKLPYVKDENFEAAVRLAYYSALPNYLAGQTELIIANLFIEVLSFMKRGNLSGGEHVILAIAFFLLKLGFINKGCRFNEFALDLAELHGDSDAQIITRYEYLSRVPLWKKAMQKMAEDLSDHCERALENGNTLIAYFSLGNSLLVRFYCGEPLLRIIESLDQLIEMQKKLTIEVGGLMVSYFQQVFLNLKGHPERGGREIASARDPNDRALSGIACALDMLVAWLDRDMAKARALIEEFPLYEPMMSDHFAAYEFYFYRALALITLYKRAPFSEGIALAIAIKRELRRFERYEKLISVNFYCKLSLLRAKWAEARGRVKEAMLLYDRAIAAAKENDFLIAEAIANEEAARFYSELRVDSLTLPYLERAVELYGKWGAAIKRETLLREFSKLLAPAREMKREMPLSLPRATEFTATMGTLQFDAFSALKAVEAIASTLFIDELLHKLMAIAMEHGGADRAALLLPKGERYLLEALSSKKSGKTELLHSAEVDDKTLPKTILQTVVRFKREVLLKEGTDAEFLGEDPYFSDNPVKSILCLPLINKERIAAILYLENRLMKSSFTEEKTALLRFISSQLAMSIDNAKLYESTIALNRSYERFVPKEFISLLGKKEIIDVQLGDQVERTLSVLFMDVRDFTALSEQMTPEENFAFVNEFLGFMEPAIHRHGGFIDKYIGDAIMALFSKGVESALDGALEMVEALKGFNLLREKNGKKTIRIGIGIGINSGLTILGTVGNKRRMDGTVISDVVNTASRIEHLTKDYGKVILVSERCAAMVEEPSRYTFELVGEVEIRGKKEKMRLFSLEGKASDVRG